VINPQQDGLLTPNTPGPQIPNGPPPAPKPWGGWATLGLGAAVLAVYFIVQSGVALVFAFWRIIDNPDQDILQLIEKLVSDGLLISIATVLSAIFGVAMIVLFISKRRGFGLSQYLNLQALPRKTWLILLGLFAGLLAISVLASLLWSQIEDPGFTAEAYNTSRWPAFFGIAVVIFAPFFEEIYFRGFLFKGLRDSALGVRGTIALTSFLWALLHVQYNYYGMAQIFLLGIVFGLVRWKTDSLHGSLLLHCLWNLAAFISAAVAVNA
jgi:uncharacterized protein